MAQTTTASALTVQQWESKFFMEYVRESLFKPYMGTSINSVIQIKENLTKKKGDTITLPFVRALSGAGVTGNTALKGNEEALSNYGHDIEVDVLRHGVLVTDWEEQKSAIDMREAAKEALKFWAMDKLRDQVITALQSPVTNGSTSYADATEGQKDTWLAANSDRVLFGATKSNNSSNDHSSSLSNIDNTNDKLDADMVSLVKRMAKTASPAIRPIRVNGSEEWFVLFANSLAFRDFKTDSTVQQANREAWMRGKTNPLFRDGDVLWDGVIVREVPEISVISGVGAGSIDVAPNFMCGAQAVGVAWAQRTTTRVDNDDYDFQHGVAIQEIRGIEKLMNNTAQNGVVTVYSAGVADS